MKITERTEFIITCLAAILTAATLILIITELIKL